MVDEWTPTQLQQALEANKSVFIKLWKEGCGACKLASPAVERLAASDEYKSADHSVAFAQISVSEFPEMMDLADDEVLPLFFLFHQKKLVGKVKGFKGIAKLQELLNQITPKVNAV